MRIWLNYVPSMRYGKRGFYRRIPSCYAAYHASYTLSARATGTARANYARESTCGHRLGSRVLRCVPHSPFPPKKICVFCYACFVSCPFWAYGSSLWWPFFSPILPNMDRGMQMISMEVSKDVPVPPDKRRYPYKVMEVGDSFFVDGGKLQVVCNNNYRTGKKLDRKFIARCEKEGVRVWRTA